MSATIQRTYTKEQKIEKRKKVYLLAKSFKKCLERKYPNPNNMAKLEILFCIRIMDGNFKESLEIHKMLKSVEEKCLDSLVFDKTQQYNSEDVRVGCSNIKRTNSHRKIVLEYAMICDATVGYWKLSK